ncbi:phosphatase PAP2 family protein [Nocardioides sp.]|uniref:phosphatase PAP2 family protein n=1 Tax=Nocardioides sp. TaxID=35761 RepID=UPI001A31280E|nr:phosphatase PAP2 family protein [Nocardioides sp.]MBJ7356182.1 phosphatase PAP2 family protein [Nocardioides sp.]
MAARRPLSRLSEWREDRIGDRDLTRWTTAAGVALVRATTWLVALALRLLPAGLRSRLADRELPWLVLLATTAVGGALAVLATAASAELYDGVEDGEGATALDRPVLDWVAGWRTPWLDDAVTAYTDLGGAHLMIPLVAVAAGALWWWWRRPTPAILLAIAAAGSLLMTVVGKQVVGRVRPPQELAVPPFESSPSFPSGHTLNSWVLWILIGYLVAVRTRSRWVAVVALAVATGLAMAMGLSRVYLGHHWLTDVLVGWTLGAAWLAVIVTGHRLALTVRRKTSGAPEWAGDAEGVPS